MSAKVAWNVIIVIVVIVAVFQAEARTAWFAVHDGSLLLLLLLLLVLIMMLGMLRLIVEVFTSVT